MIGRAAQAQDALVFAEEDTERPGTTEAALEEPWTVLVVDDEEDVHAVTKLVLETLEYAGRGVALLHAFSAECAREIIDTTPNIALIFLDVVMESDDAGLQLVDYIRNERKDSRVRIILRTGQPGHAPERRVVSDYEIDDYRSKAELTSMKLYTSAVTALRSYAAIVALEASRRGLETILDAASSLTHTRSMELFASGVLQQIAGLLGVAGDGMLCVYQNGSETAKEEATILAATGCFEEFCGPLFDAPVGVDFVSALLTALYSGRDVELPAARILYFQTRAGRRFVVAVRTRREPTEVERRLLASFCEHVSAGMDNMSILERLAASHDKLRRAHLATLNTLSVVAEGRLAEGTSHAVRVAALSQAIAQFLRRNSGGAFLDEEYIETIGLAGILHDVGKASTPAHVLEKPGPLDEEELAIVRRHASAGRALLEKARDAATASKVLELAIEIAGSHHEWFDGTGYPNGLAGTGIPLSARIVAVADVYDALTHDRVYGSAWSVQQALAYIEGRSGTQFDPQVVRALLAVV